MERDEKKFRALLQKYNQGICTQEEIAWLESWYLQLNEKDKASLSRTELDEERSAIWAAVENQTHEITSTKLWPRIAAAASVLLVLGTGLFFYKADQAPSMPKLAKTSIYKNDIAPGGVKATLTLADGRKITLDGAKNGALAQETGITITKAADGQLIYTVSDSKSKNAFAFNTISTPKGGQYQVRLPDGTEVWLNAASSLKFPVSFSNSKQRKVELEGEAYFEVAHNKQQPFIVKTNRQDVEVLGTHFDVKSYADEPVTKTTLLEGSVRLNGSTILKPGQQGLSKGNSLNVKQVDVDEELDWKNKQFILNDEDLQVVMRRLARWYDVEVVYEGEPADVQFVGVVSSTRNISGVLKLMERTGKVHFKIEGKKITVLKQP
ncbi:FecR family protein [Pedobacter westerhofensis]|uniref:FecR family protein n=1 Tax=Pedobacter westerhofensis TaxID=425512 RepID=A0A521FBU0_9SPHI|nr:FecR family protein [Pedobacter westerhofensis]SMO93623.1 FecR family protein [Pedobacter westerhofensis]